MRKGSTIIQFTFFKRPFWLLLPVGYREQNKKARKLGTERGERLHHISGRSGTGFLWPVVMGLGVISAVALEPHNL